MSFEEPRDDRRKSSRWIPIGIGLLLVMLSLTTAPSCQQNDQAFNGASGVTGDKAVPAATSPASAAEDSPLLVEAKLFKYPPALDVKEPTHREAGSRSCLACHIGHDSYSMHQPEQEISCADCHGGNPAAAVPAGVAEMSRTAPEFLRAKNAAHPTPAVPDLWKTSGNPVASGAASIRETPDYIRFVNPGDLRAAMVSCGACHREQVQKVRTSMMTHGAMLWGAALYNNGAINRKASPFGEFYTVAGEPARVVQQPLPTTRQFDQQGILPQLWPLPRWETTQPGNILRVFERGGKMRPIIGVPETKEDPGRPDVKLSVRGFGTDVRTDPVFIGLQKTRLLDPTLNFAGSNDHPGDYRASGCSACHVVYANDRSPVHSGLMWSKFGNRGESFSDDKMLNTPKSPATAPSSPPEDRWNETAARRESGHPIKHQMVRNMPTSTCISCHIHPGTNVVNSYMGFMWWDNETDGRLMYPKRQQNPDSDTTARVNSHNPEGSAVRGLWSNEYPNEADHEGVVAGPNFLEKLGTPEFNQRLTRTQFGDFHGHGWVFRAVFKQDRHGNLLDYEGKPVPPHNPAEPKVFNEAMRKSVAFTSNKEGDHPPAGAPVHLKDIHLEKGMHCVDCHFQDDSHGNGNLYGETRNAVHITCEDCHGTFTATASIYRYLKIREGIDTESAAGEKDRLLEHALSGNAANSTDAAVAKDRAKKLVDGKSARFRIRPEDNRFVQISAIEPGVEWPVPQTAETADSSSAWSKSHDSSAAGDKSASQTTRARYAHTIRKDGKTWGSIPSDAETKSGHGLAHADSRVSCYTCHSSWATSCFGCHLPMQANRKTPMLHNEASITRNYTNYNYQTLRDDLYMLGIDSTAKDHKVVPIRSACAVVVSSQDANRQWLYSQQQTVSAEGYAGTAFSPYFPHTVRATETRQCSDCHISKANDNNAALAQLLLQGTNAVNFIGRFAWVAEAEHGLEAVVVTERDEPQAVIGSTLHQLAYPDDYQKHAKGRNGRLAEAHSHHGTVLDIQVRGEYAYTACGPEGFIAYDIANIDNKGFSERIVTSPVSPLGQRLYVKTKYATSVCSPSTLAVDPTRARLEVEQKLSDGSVRKTRPNQEDVITEIGDPSLRKPDRPIHPLYAYLYITDREEGLVVIGNRADSPNGPGVSTLLDGNPENNFLERAATFNPSGLLRGARHLALHGAIAYVCCDAGVVPVDLEDPTHPKLVTDGENKPVVLGGPDIRDARRIAFQFRYGFVCDADGLKVLDVTNPRLPRVVKDASSRPIVVPLADARDIYVCRTYGYIAAGKDGLVIVDLERPESPKRMSYPRDIALDYNGAAGIDDATAIRVGMTNTSLFAYIADGRNGLKILQLTSPEYSATFGGFSPKPEPHLVAWYKTNGPAVALSKGLDRDRAVDESGNQLAVFGRKGARPFTLAEMQKLYLRGEGANRSVYTVSDTPETAATEPAAGPTQTTPTQPATPEPPKPRPKLPFGTKK
jgi:hypothetical protein